MGNYLISGVLGFIGFHLARTLLQEGHMVTGIDEINDYYSPKIKIDRGKALSRYGNFEYRLGTGGDIENCKLKFLLPPFSEIKAIHLAAHSGVRGAVGQESVFINNNISNTGIFFDKCIELGIKDILFASSSSVYGNADKKFVETDRSDRPEGIYAATKKCDEIIASYYAKQYNLNISALRFFTVYGEWGRPDMAVSIFTDKIWRGQEVPLFGHGNLKRDFIHIDDLVRGIKLVLDNAKGYSTFNIGSEWPITNGGLAEKIASIMNLPLKTKDLPIQPGEALCTHADTNKIKAIGFENKVGLEDGLKRYVKWHTNYYKK